MPFLSFPTVHWHLPAVPAGEQKHVMWQMFGGLAWSIQRGEWLIEVRGSVWVACWLRSSSLASTKLLYEFTQLA